MTNLEKNMSLVTWWTAQKNLSMNRECSFKECNFPAKLMSNNRSYKVTKSGTDLWILKCIDKTCECSDWHWSLSFSLQHRTLHHPCLPPFSNSFCSITTIFRSSPLNHPSIVKLPLHQCHHFQVSPAPKAPLSTKQFNKMIKKNQPVCL